MAQFSYKKSPSKNSKNLLFAWMIGFIVFSGIALYCLYINQGLYIGKFIIILLAPFSIGLLSAAWYLSKADRHWEIEISDGILNWQAPSNLGIFTEKSFSVELNNIDKIISKKPWPDSQLDQELEFSIALKDGTTINLSMNSGIPISDLIMVLEKMGVSHEAQNI